MTADAAVRVVSESPRQRSRRSLIPGVAVRPVFECRPEGDFSGAFSFPGIGMSGSVFMI